MKKNVFVSVAILIVVALTMSGFMSPLGGEGYEIYVNNKLFIRQFGAEMKQVKNLELDPSKADGEITVKFFHCGMSGKDRQLQVKTPDKKLLKEWQFANDKPGNFSISVPLKEIVRLQKKGGAGTLHLYYTSREAPDGRFLAGLSTTRLRQVDAR